MLPISIPQGSSISASSNARSGDAQGAFVGGLHSGEFTVSNGGASNSQLVLGAALVAAAAWLALRWKRS